MKMGLMFDGTPEEWQAVLRSIQRSGAASHVSIPPQMMAADDPNRYMATGRRSNDGSAQAVIDLRTGEAGVWSASGFQGGVTIRADGYTSANYDPPSQNGMCLGRR